MSGKVATVEDFDSQIQEAVPTSRIQAFKKRASGLASVTNYSDAGTIDSGYSSNSALNGLEEPEHFPDVESPSRNSPQSDISDRAPLGHGSSGLDSEDRQSRASNPNRISGRYAYAHISRIERPLSRSASKSSRNGRASPAIRPIDTNTGNDDCDCQECSIRGGSGVKSQASPSIRPPNSSGIDSSWPQEIMNSLPTYNPHENDWGHNLMSNSPGKSRVSDSHSNSFFPTCPTSGSRPSSLLSGSNPLGSFVSAYADYTASPSTYTPSSAVNPIHSPAPYLGGGSEDPSSWMSSLNGVPPTPTSLHGSGVDDYLSYSGTNDYLYGGGSGAVSATGGNAPSYDLPPRSASVQPSGLKTGRLRSSTYHVDYGHSQGSMGPPSRRPSSKMPMPKRIHSSSNSYDGRYDSSLSYDRYDTTFDHPSIDDYSQPPPINRRLSRTANTGSGLPTLDIARATSVPPADNYLVGLDRARRNTSMTPQPLAIQNRERNRRGSNASSGLSSSASRRAHEARLAEMVELVKVEPRPDMALAKRESAGAIVKHSYAQDYNYGMEGDYGNYDYPYDNSGMELGPYHEDYESDALVLSSHSDPLTSRYGLPPKLHYAGDPLHRSLRLNSDRRRSVNRRLSDYQHAMDPYSHANDLEELRHLSKSRNSSRLPNPAIYDDGYLYGQ